MPDEGEGYVTLSRAAKIVGLTEKQLAGMCGVVVGGQHSLRYKYARNGALLIDRDSLTELFLGYTGGWDK